VRDLILQKRDIFISQMQIDTKREALQRLDHLEHQQEQNLLAKEAELNLFRDQFRNFLENDGKNTMAVRTAAEIKCHRRVDISDQIMSVSAGISSLRSEIAHSREKLKECQDYKVFLDSLTPPAWRSEHPLPEMFFTSPAQLLDIMTTLEQQTMFLISHCQDAEETLDRYRAQFNQLMETRDGSMVSMEEERRRRDTEVREMSANNDRYTAPGELREGNELPEAELLELQEAIRDFHMELGFDVASSNDTTTMLTRIEEKLEQLMMTLGKLDPLVFKQKAQLKELERRDQEREAKNIREKAEQEEKTQRAIELAMMPIKRRTGRPLLERMVPLKGQTREKREESARLRQAREAADAEMLFGAIWE
jgi:hypothetical protein